MHSIRYFIILAGVFMLCDPRSGAAAADKPSTAPAARADQPKSVVFVLDSSGSMLDMFNLLRGQIRLAIDQLRPEQSFNVVFFQENRFLAVDEQKLMAASAGNKRKASEFLNNVVPRGVTDPIPALEAVAAMEPELIWLFTDGDFSGPGNEKVIEYCKQKFGARTKINTIAFISRDSKDNPQDLAFVAALKAIAANSGGKFSHVSEDDLEPKRGENTRSTGR